MSQILAPPQKTRADDRFIPLRDKNKQIVGYAICADQDYEAISKLTWWRNTSKDGWYAVTTFRGKNIRMHQFVIMNVILGLETPDNKTIDHVNRVRHDNHRSNLVFVTWSQNAQNRPKQAGESAQRGVSVRSRGSKKYIAKVHHNKHTVFIGCFATENEAAEAFDRYVAHHPEIKTPINEEGKRAQYQNEPLVYPKAKTAKRQAFRGVQANGQNRFRARIKIGGTSIHIATTDTALEAARCYDKYIIDNNMSNPLNFPESYPEYRAKKEIKTTVVREIDDVTIQISINGTNANVPVLIDKTEYDRVKHYPCHVNNGYVNIYTEMGTKRLARYLLNVDDPNVIIDHINNNRLDYRKANLREATRQTNPQNTTKRAGTTSRFVGVMRTKCNTWRACVKHQGQVLQKVEKTELHAAIRRDLFILTDARLKGTLYKLNFEWTRQGEEGIDPSFQEPPFDEELPWLYKHKT